MGVVIPGVSPYRPGAQSVQEDAPTTLYLPAGHRTPAVALPGGQAYPAGHGPLQAAVVSPPVAPYSPGAHPVHSHAPTREYRPEGHIWEVGLGDPGGHAYPGLHSPVHDDVDSPGVDPYRPASQGPVQAAEVRPKVAP